MISLRKPNYAALLHSFDSATSSFVELTSLANEQQAFAQSDNALAGDQWAPQQSFWSRVLGK